MSMKKRNRLFKIERGQIYWIKLPGDPWINQQRPVLVLQNDIGNRFCPTVIVTPLINDTSTKNLFFSVHIPHKEVEGLQEDLVVLLFQLFTLPRDLFASKNLVGTLPAYLMQKVDEGLKLSLGLSMMQQIQSRFYWAQEG
jgi:mRNA interferase MazF